MPARYLVTGRERPGSAALRLNKAPCRREGLGPLSSQPIGAVWGQVL